MRRRDALAWMGGAVAVAAGCATFPPPAREISTELPVLASRLPGPRTPSTQLVVVTTASWDTTAGIARRFERPDGASPWRAVGRVVPVVIGRTGLAWDDRSEAPLHGAPRAPVKREGDGRSPAGRFALDTVFGFAAAASMPWARMPYVPVTEHSECVDDVSSVHYNTIVDRDAVARVDWASAERMRTIGQYALGVTVRYNGPVPRPGLGSCIFLHIWAGPDSVTAGCTAMPEHDLRDLVLWLDRARSPTLVQLPRAEYDRLRGEWSLP